MSSAILYLAIVAIWAFLLVPRWIHRPHASVAGSAEFAGQPADGEFEDRLASAPSADAPAATPPGALSRDAGAHSADGDAHDEPDADTAPIPVVPPPAAAHPAASSATAGRVPSPPAPPAPARPSRPGSTADPSGHSGHSGPGSPARPRLSRAKVIQARRRLLTILVALAVAAASLTALRLTSPWVCVPPAIMLVLYVLLLRETALADAEHARRQAEAAAAARQQAEAQARAQRIASAAHPGAQVIDISARLTDQLYDQYEDATFRAVGD